VLYIKGPKDEPCKCNVLLSLLLVPFSAQKYSFYAILNYSRSSGHEHRQRGPREREREREIFYWKPAWCIITTQHAQHRMNAPFEYNISKIEYHDTVYCVDGNHMIRINKQERERTHSKEKQK